jgi:hypothetical protein
MASVPSEGTPRGTRLYPFVPSGADFELAVKFFEAIGFEVAWRGDGLAGLRFGGAYFLLQDTDVPVWQENQMVTFEVTDLDGYWAMLEGKNLPDLFPGVRVRPPTEFPWGREVHLIDPAGVCWHVREGGG